MYPFRSRLAWLLAGRHKHLTRAFADHPAADTLVHERLASLARWGRARSMVVFLLSIGVIASLVSLLVQRLPGFGVAEAALQDTAAVAGAFTGLFTLAFLFLTRLLSQIEADILTLLLTKA